MTTAMSSKFPDSKDIVWFTSALSRSLGAALGWGLVHGSTPLRYMVSGEGQEKDSGLWEQFILPLLRGPSDKKIL